MGQYHKFMNFDKKEVIEPSSFRKLMEWSYQGNDYLCAVEKLLKNEWKGDRVLVIGDYIDESYDDPIFEKLLTEIQKENSSYGIGNIYWYPYKEIKQNYIEATPTRYIYNHAKKQYIDIKRQPIQWCGYDEKHKEVYGAKIHPLSLLLSCSNGHGGGDYGGKNNEMVGLWCSDSSQIELSDKKLNNDYIELKVVFDEYEHKLSTKDLLVETLYEHFNKDSIDKLDKINFSSNLLLSDAEKAKIIGDTKQAILTFSKDIQEKDELDLEK